VAQRLAQGAERTSRKLNASKSSQRLQEPGQAERGRSERSKRHAWTLEELEESLQQLETWYKEIQESRELSEQHLGFFVVDASPLRRALLAMCACLRLRLLGCLQRWFEEDCTGLARALHTKYSEIIMQPKTADELQSTLEAVNGLDGFLQEKEPRLARLRDMFDLLQPGVTSSLGSRSRGCTT
jgi:hypothetical protein